MSDGFRRQTHEASDPEALLAALDGRIDELAHQAYERFARELPEARQWSEQQRTNFIDQARGRFGAVLAVTGQGASVDEALRRDLQSVGANAALAGSSLPHLLLVLRISRDLLLQMAMRMAHERQGTWNASLAAFAVRMLPAIDRLTDSLSEGFWTAKLDQIRQDWHRLASVIERSPYGVYEADLDGIVQYANDAFANITGKPGMNMQGMALSDVLKPIGGSGNVAALLAEPPDDFSQVTFTIEGPGGNHAVLEIDTAVRRSEGVAVGFGGIVRHVKPDSVAGDTSGMVRHIHELRRSIVILGEAGDFLARHASQMGVDQVQQAGESVRRQAARLELILDELDEDRKAGLPGPQ